MFKAITFILTLFWFGACVPNQNTYVADIKTQEWSAPVQVSYPNSDTTTLHDIHIFTRYTSQMAGQNLEMTLKISDPSGAYIIDSICIATPASRDNFGEVATLYRTGNILGQQGDYTFTFSPLDPATQGVVGLGIIID